MSGKLNRASWLAAGLVLVLAAAVLAGIQRSFALSLPPSVAWMSMAGLVAAAWLLARWPQTEGLAVPLGAAAGLYLVREAFLMPVALPAQFAQTNVMLPASVVLMLHGAGVALAAHRSVRAKGTLALLVGGGVTLGVLLAYHKRDLTVPLLVYFVAGFLLQAVVHWSRLLSRWQSEGVVSRGPGLPAWVGRTAAVLVLILLAAWVYPAQGPTLSLKDTRLRLADAAIMRLTGASGTGFGPGAANEAVAGYGWYDDNLGGSWQRGNRPVMTVRADQPLYWRGEAKEVYTGRGWTTTPTTLYSVPPSTRGPDQWYFMPRVLDWVRSTFMDRSSPDRAVMAELTLAKDWSGPPVVFTPLSPLGVEVRGAEPNRMRIDPRNGNLYLDRQPNRELSYRVSAVLPNQAAARRARGSAGPELAQYLQLPDTVTERTRALARQAVAGATTPYERAKALEQFLRTHYPYSEYVPAAAQRNNPRFDFVDSFLFEQRQGYCTYFSSAMVVMARSLGLPARWVKGYTSGTWDEQRQAYVVTEANAHAWVEIWFDGAGWVSFDPTPGYGPGGREQLPQEQLAPQKQNPAGMPSTASNQTAAATAAKETTPSLAPPPAEKSSWLPWESGDAADAAGAQGGVLPWLGAAVLAAAAGWLWWRRRHRFHLPAMPGGAAGWESAAPPDQVVRSRFRALEQRLSGLHLARRRAETPTEYVSRVALAFPAQAAAAARSLTDLYLRARYQPGTLTAAAAAQAERDWRLLDETLPRQRPA